MKKLLPILLGIALVFTLSQVVPAAAQTTKSTAASGQQKAPEGSKREEQLEKSVHIVGEPAVGNLTATSATLTWQTNKTAATDVHYREAGTQQWKVAYEPGGNKDHSVTLTGLKPGKSYEYEIRTREGEVRKKGTFQTPAQ